jgi:hypothetical protein
VERGAFWTSYGRISKKALSATSVPFVHHHEREDPRACEVRNSAVGSWILALVVIVCSSIHGFLSFWSRLRCGVQGSRREGDTWSRGLRFVSTIRTGSVGLDGICDGCTWTFYPTQVYLNVRCFLVTVEPYTRIVEVKSSPLPPQHAKRAKVRLSLPGGREREREYRRVPPSQPLFTSIPSLALYQWTSTSISTISTIPARSDNPS